MRHTPRFFRAAAGAAIAIVAIVAPGAAGASSGPQCSATMGVTVIVDFTHFGGNIERGCAPDHPADTLAAIHAAGFTTAGTAQFGDAFLCRIDGYPSARVEACAVTPSSTAYWAYWYARPSDAKWTYSAQGVLSSHPAAGSIEAFSFGDRAQPGISPAAAVPTTTLPPAAQAVPAASTSVASTTIPATASTATTAAPPPASTSTAATTVSAPSTRAPRTTPHLVDRVATGPVHGDSSGSPLPAYLTTLVIGVLALAAFAFARARRHRPA